MRRIITIIFMIFFAANIYAQDSTIHWESFKEATAKFKQKQKPILLFAYDRDNTLCKKMLDSTLQKNEVANYINVLFYPVKFDIETFDTITFFNGQKFVHPKSEKYNSLTKTLIGDSIATPVLVMFDKKAQGTVFYGYKNRDSIFPILIYYSEGVYNWVTYEQWEKIYYKTYPPGEKQIITHLNIHWMTMKEMLEKQKTQPRKVFIDIYNNYSIAQTIMRLKVYNNPQIARYLNRNFYNVTVPLTSKKEITIKGVTYKNTGAPLNYNEFAVAVLNGKMKFPAFIILDEKLNLLERIQAFVTKNNFSDIVHFYGDNDYKKENYKNYLLKKKNKKSTQK